MLKLSNMGVSELPTPQPHGLRFHDTQFWVIHRRTEYGPFDYEWNVDFRGVELHYRGRKFGEVCSVHEIFADMKEFRLPMRVVEVASVVFGCLLVGLSKGLNAGERMELLAEMLREFNYGEFVPAGH